MRIEVCTDRIIHVLITLEQNLPKQPLTIVPKAWNPASYSLKADDKQLLIRTDALKVRIARDSGVVSFFSLSGKPFLKEVPEILRQRWNPVRRRGWWNKRFPGMAKVQTLRVFLVREGEGMSIRSQSKLEAVIDYNGSAQLIKLARKSAG